MSNCFCHFNGYEVKDAKARNDIEALQSDVNSLESDVNNNKNTINSLDHINNTNKIICIGDSYGAGYSPDGNTKSWTDLFKEYLGYDDTNFYSNSYGGTGFYSTSDNKNFLTLLQELESEINDKSLVKYIYVLGGYNDESQATSDVRSGVTSFINYVKANYPNANIYIGCVGYSLNNAGTRENLIYKVLPIYKNVNSKGANYLYNIEYILHNPRLMSSDNVHPNQDGQSEIAKFLVNTHKGLGINTDVITLANNKIPVTSYEALSTYDLSSNDSEKQINIGKQVVGELTMFTIQGFLIFNTPISTTGGGVISLSDLTIQESSVNKYHSLQYINKFMQANIFVRTSDSNGQLSCRPATLYIINNVLTINLNDNVTDIKNIFIPEQQFYVPSVVC